jgi:hypothetical protein
MASVLSVEYLWIFLKSKNNYLNIFILLSLPIFIEGIIHTAQVSSLSYDFALLITILAICAELIRGENKSIFIAMVLSMVLVTIKLSGVVFALVVIVFAAYKLIYKKPRSVKLFLIVSIGIIFLFPHIVRNIILSGWPFYPIPVLGLNVPWAVPDTRVNEIFRIIRAWSIHPGPQWPTVIGQSFVQWFPGWFLQNLKSIEFKIIFIAVAFLIGSILLKYINKKTIKKNIGLVICWLASFASIFYMILSAPDFRFGSIFFWVFFPCLGSFFFVGFFKQYPNLGKIIIIVPILFVVFVYWPPRLDSELMLRSVRWDQSFAKNQILIKPKDGSPAFKIYIPKADGDCGNSELPCTPDVDNGFKEIVPGDISRGFAPVK